MASSSSDITKLVIRLYEINAFKFGNYKMKIGANSPVYFDLRVIVSFPDVVDTICRLLHESSMSKIKCDHVCGVPYTALPIASVISVKYGIPMLIRRKETKDYGTKKLIEGQFKSGDTCVIIEDVITSGSSVLETANDLKNSGLNVTDAFIILDRQQGGKQALEDQNIKVESLFTLMQLIEILVEAGKIDSEMKNKVEDYLKSSQFYPVVPRINKRLSLKFEERVELAENTVAEKLFQIMSTKKSNLCLAADLTSCSAILDLFIEVAPYICMLKLHVDIIEDFNIEFTSKLKDLAKLHNVILMEDRKFADIGNTVVQQYTSGVYRIKDWADLVTIHALSGPGCLKGIKSVITDEVRGVFVVIEMSSEGNLLTSSYSSAAMKMALEDSDLVAGIVGQNKDLLSLPGLIQLTPGVQLVASNDALGQNYNSPEEVVINKGADIAVVGRGIIKSSDPAKEAKIYRDRLWDAYLKRIKMNN